MCVSFSTTGLNNMVVRAPRKIVQYDASFGVPLETVDTDYSDHPLVIGKRYVHSDVRYYCASSLGVYSSGVCGECSCIYLYL